MKYDYVYIMANESRMLYVGVTGDLQRRVFQHKQKLIRGYTSQYTITHLVHFETTGDIKSAIVGEKQIKSWLRAKKVALIESLNPQWKDLSTEWFE